MVISSELIILLLRIAVALVLYTFLGVMFYYLRRDVEITSEQIHEVRRAAGKLVVTACDDDVSLDVGRQFRLQPVTLVGRSPTCTLVLPDSFVSTEHARISVRRGQWWLDDLDSRNGTTLNGVPLAGPVVLSTGDIIGIGRVEFRFEAA